MKLNVLKKDELVETVDLSNEILSTEDSLKYFIGRDEGCRVVLDDPKVSREHGELIYNNGSWSIKKSSIYGILVVNGAPINEKDLSTGDIISIPPYSILVEAGLSTANGTNNETLETIEDKNNEEVTEEPVLENESDSEFSLGAEESEEEQEFSESENHEFDNSTQEFGIEEGDDMIDEHPDSSDYEMDNFDEGTKVFNRFARYELIITGEASNFDTYVIEDNETLIGRDPSQVKIFLNDPQVSSIHAKLSRIGSVVILEDMKSGNGTLLNGSRVNKSEIQNGDTFEIGETKFTVKIVSDFLKNESDSLMPVQENQVVEVEEIVEVDADFDDEVENSEVSSSKSLFTKDALKDPAKRKKIIYIVFGLIVISFLLEGPDDAKKVAKENDKKNKSNRLKNNTPKTETTNAKYLKKLTPEEKELVESNYQLASELIDNGKYSEALLKLTELKSIIPVYSNSDTLYGYAKEGLSKLEQVERERRELEEKRKIKIQVKKFVDKAQTAFKDDNIEAAEGYLTKIMELDPENIEVTQLRIDIDAFKDKKRQEEIEAEAKKVDRERKLDQLAPGKKFFLEKEWYKTILKLTEFLDIKRMDEDLVKEATDMISKSRENLKSMVDPMIGKARSLKEGQDLKGAYEIYNEVFSIDPSNEEAIDNVNEIKDILLNRSKKIYRDAILSESLSMFDEAKEKFKEVQQISPSDSEYYKKATLKLKHYLD